MNVSATQVAAQRLAHVIASAEALVVDARALPDTVASIEVLSAATTGLRELARSTADDLVGDSTPIRDAKRAVEMLAADLYSVEHESDLARRLRSDDERKRSVYLRSLVSRARRRSPAASSTHVNVVTCGRAACMPAAVGA